MSLVQTAFLDLTLDNIGGISAAASGAIEFTSYTVIDTLMANADTIELVCERTSASAREVILVTKTSNGNYVLTSRGLYGTTAQTHAQSTEVSHDDTPGYYNGLRDASAFPTGTTSVGIPVSKIKQEAWTAWVPTYGATGSMTYGTVTTNSARYIQIGKTVFFQLSADGTTGGTASDTITFTLPVTAKNALQQFSGYITDVTSLAAFVYSVNATTAGVRGYGGANYGLGAGKVINIYGFYEVA